MRDRRLFEPEAFEFEADLEGSVFDSGEFEGGFGDMELGELEGEYEGSSDEFEADFEEADELEGEAPFSWEMETGGPAYARWIQTALNRTLGLHLIVDGNIGAHTRSAIRTFQKKHGLPASGTVDSRTQAALVSAGAPPPPGTITARPSGTVVTAAPPAGAGVKPTYVNCPRPGRLPRAILDHFSFDRTDLNRGCHALLLNDVAGRMVQSQRSRQPLRSVLLVGHTDAVGSASYNVGLARRRAEAVLHELQRVLERMRPGITRTIRFQIASCGEMQTKATPALSRRVEIFLPAPPAPTVCAPFKERVRLHMKILVQPTRFSIATMLASMRQVYEPAGFMVEVVTCENLALKSLEDLDVFCPGTPAAVCCPFPCATNHLNPEHISLFRNRNSVGANELVVYFVHSTIPGLNGCCAHPPGRPGVVVTSLASQWSMAHEIGHVLGLQHVNNNDRLMTGNGTNNVTHPPPDLIASEIRTMTASNFTMSC